MVFERRIILGVVKLFLVEVQSERMNNGNKDGWVSFFWGVSFPVLSHNWCLKNVCGPGLSAHNEGHLNSELW